MSRIIFYLLIGRRKTKSADETSRLFECAMWCCDRRLNRYQLLRVRRSDFVKIAVPGTDVQDCVQWAQNFEESNDEVSSEPIRSNESKSSSKLPSAVAGEGAGGGGAQTDSSAPAAEHCDDAASPSIAGSFKARPRYHLAVGQRLVGTICVPNVFNDSDDEEHADDDDELDTWVRGYATQVLQRRLVF